MPCSGVAPDAIAKESESGIETKATVRPDFQFVFIVSIIWAVDIEKLSLKNKTRIKKYLPQKSFGRRKPAAQIL